MKRSLLTVLAILVFALAACKAPAGAGSDNAAPSQATTESAPPAESGPNY